MSCDNKRGSKEGKKVQLTRLEKETLPYGRHNDTYTVCSEALQSRDSSRHGSTTSVFSFIYFFTNVKSTLLNEGGTQWPGKWNNAGVESDTVKNIYTHANFARWAFSRSPEFCHAALPIHLADTHKANVRHLVKDAAVFVHVGVSPHPYSQH